jgi:hypothetical protein
LPHPSISEQTTKHPESLAKPGISQEKGALDNNDKDTFHLPRHSSFTINHTFVNLGKTGQNVPESIEITTV